MFDKKFAIKALWLGGLFMSSLVVPAVSAQSAAPPKKPAVAASPTRYQPARFSKRAELHYGMVWGVDSLAVKWTESGEVIRFTYRVLDAAKAKPLNDKKSEPALIDPQAGVKLSVPAL